MVAAMGMRASDMCPAARRLQVAALVFGILGSILAWVGLALPFWHVKSNIHTGVFQTCQKTFDQCITTNDASTDYKSVTFSTLLWGLAIGGSILLLIGLYFLLMYPIRKTVDHLTFSTLLWGLAIGGSILLLIGLYFMLMYPIRKTVDHCKMTLAIFSAIFLIAAVITLVACLAIFVDWFHRYDARYSLSDWDIWEDLGFAWYLTILGVILVLGAIIALGLHTFFLLYYSEGTSRVRGYGGKFNYN